MTKPDQWEPSRREMMMASLFGGGLLGLRALASGLPAWLLANPRRALAAGTCASPSAQYLIYSCSDGGDPINTNVPGTYLDPTIVHPADPRMSPTPLTLQGTSVIAAQPWSTLPQNVLDRTCFFHHGTYTVVHSDMVLVQGLQNAVAQSEMLVSMIAAQLAPCLGTVQAQPFVLGPRTPTEDVTFQGAPQPIVSPTALAGLLGSVTGPLAALQKLRDNDVNRMNAWFRTNANAGQRNFIDQYVLSQSQARQLSQSLIASLQTIPDDSPDSQATAAVTLIQMNVAPVISLNIPFGGDNHDDTNLDLETAQTISGVATLSGLMQKLAAAGLQDRVTFMNLNVFGRTLTGLNGMSTGRNHQANHHCSVIIGKPFRGVVVGGVEPSSGDFAAQSIDATTGAGVPGGGGNIPFTSSLTAMGTTLCTGLGVDSAALARSIPGGQVVRGALS